MLLALSDRVSLYAIRCPESTCPSTRGSTPGNGRGLGERPLIASGLLVSSRFTAFSLRPGRADPQMARRRHVGLAPSSRLPQMPCSPGLDREEGRIFALLPVFPSVRQSAAFSRHVCSSIGRRHFADADNASDFEWPMLLAIRRMGGSCCPEPMPFWLKDPRILLSCHLRLISFGAQGWPRWPKTSPQVPLEARRKAEAEDRRCCRSRRSRLRHLWICEWRCGALSPASPIGASGTGPQGLLLLTVAVVEQFDLGATSRSNL